MKRQRWNAGEKRFEAQIRPNRQKHSSVHCTLHCAECPPSQYTRVHPTWVSIHPILFWVPDFPHPAKCMWQNVATKFSTIQVLRNDASVHKVHKYVHSTYIKYVLQYVLFLVSCHQKLIGNYKICAYCEICEWSLCIGHVLDHLHDIKPDRINGYRLDITLYHTKGYLFIPLGSSQLFNTLYVHCSFILATGIRFEKLRNSLHSVSSPKCKGLSFI